MRDCWRGAAPAPAREQVRTPGPLHPGAAPDMPPRPPRPTLCVMGAPLPLAFVLLAAALTAQSTAPAIPVRVDPRIELLSAVFRLAGNPEYGQGRLERYNAAIEAHFAPHKEHAAVRQARELRRQRGISYDAVASFAVHLEGIDPPRFATRGRHPQRLDKRWTEGDARSFLAHLGEFVRDTKVQEFLAGQRELHAHAEAQMQKVVAEHVAMQWFGTFFGERPKARFQVVLGLLNGGGNYGPSVLCADGTEDLYAIVGCWDKDGQGLPRYDKSVVPTLVHEYCHSFCNPVVEAHSALLAKAGDELFTRTAAAMKAQAYGNGHTLLCESLVRACVIRYRAAAEGDQAAADEAREQARRSFAWAGALADLLATEYERDRKAYPTLHAFAPRLGAFFRDAVPRLDAQIAKAPKVVSIVPKDGARDVDPATKALVITFDRPMQDGMWSVVGGGEHFPKITGKPAYDQDRKVLTVPIELRPEWDYELWLNRGKYDSFRAADGTPLPPVQVRFRTRGQTAR